MPFSLTQRLLCIARHAYSIQQNGSVPANAQGGALPGSDCAGYLPGSPIQGVVAGQYNQDAGFVARIPEGVVVSIRGTTPPLGGFDPQQVLIDWAMDAAAQLSVAGGTPPGFPGKVHWGFYRSFMRIWQRLGPMVAAQVTAAGPGAGLFVTGHSKGGAICPLVAWRLHVDYPGRPIVVRSFAGARVGNGAFATAYNAAVPDHKRYEYDDDVVPHLPATAEFLAPLGLPTVVAALLGQLNKGYGQSGTLRFIKADGTVVGDSAALVAARLASLVNDLATPAGRTHIIACHGIDVAGDGYVRGLAHEG